MLSYIELKDPKNIDIAVTAAIATSMCYIHDSHLFCQRWYECFILHLISQDEYTADAEMIQICIDAYYGQGRDINMVI